MRILVADDDAISRAMLVNILIRFGHEVVIAKNGTEAWEAMQLSSAPKLAILDWMMPYMNGIDVCRRIQNLNTELPPYCIMLTSKGNKEDVVEGLDAGANDYLAKPFDPGELRARVEVGVRMVQLQAQLVNAIKEIQDGLQAAGKIQQSLLPKKDSEIPLTQFCWKFVSCEAIGGDIFNYFQLDERHVGMYLVDVAGHGPPAALISVLVYQYMTPCSGILIDESTTPPCIRKPSDVLNFLMMEFPLDRFDRHFTILYAVLDTQTGYLTYANAAHCAPFFVPRQGEIRLLDTAGTVIGLLGAPPYDQETVILSPGDRVVFFSDGVIERKNANNEFFGVERVRKILISSRDDELKEMVDKVFLASLNFGGVSIASDDVSVLALAFNELSPGCSNAGQPLGEIV